MRNLILASVAAVSVLAVSAPAEGQRYGHHGYNRGYGDIGPLQRRIDNVLRSLQGVRPDRRDQVRGEAISLDRQLHYAARNGLNPNEYQSFNLRINELEHRLQWASGNRGGNRFDRRDHWNRDHRGDHDHD